MKGRLVNIRLDETERKFFEVAARKSGMKMTDLIKKSVAAYVQSPQFKDEITKEALVRLENIHPTPVQILQYREIEKEFEISSLRNKRKRKNFKTSKHSEG